MVPLHRDPAGIEVELLEQRLNGGAGGELTHLAVEADADFAGGGYFFSPFLFDAR